MLILAVFCSCDIDTVDMYKVNQEIQNRIKIQEYKKANECRQKALEDAESFVDSIITEITKNSVGNDIFFPDRPKRDTSGKYYNIKLDSVNIKNLLDSMTQIK
ncbi:MAG: hypothetical protein ACM3PT_12670 [Deltaproteobacteria bacterium]